MSEKESDGDKVSKTESAPESPVTEQERDWGVSVLSDFIKGNYGACLQTLAKLELARPSDIKVAHNKAIVEYYKSDLRKTDQFRKTMHAVCGQGKVNIEDYDAKKVAEHCVIYFNQAVLLFHLKQYGSALKIMNKVFTFIEPMEESLAHRVCLLLVELHLCTLQPNKALSLIGYIETQFVCTDSNISTDKDLKPLEKEHKERKLPVSVDAATDAFHLKLLQFRTRCYLMMRQLKACKRELKTLISSGGMNVATVFLKSNLEYLRENYKKSSKILCSGPQNPPQFKDCGENISVLFYNNNGCINHYMGKPNTANYYFNKALQENYAALRSLPKLETAEPNSGRPLHTLSSNRRCDLMYNLGVSLLHSGRAIQAFDCLTESVQVYHMNPRLWLRLAECCILAHKANNEDDFNLSLRRNNLVQGLIGAGCHKKIILSPQLNRDSKYSSEGQGFAGGLLVTSVEFATLCLRNALLLLPNKLGTQADVPEGPVNGYFSSPSMPMDAAEVASLRCSTLVASAYATLCVGEYVLALSYATELLAQPNISGKHKLLGHLYAAESLILLDRLSDAIEHLRPELANDVHEEISPADKDLDTSFEDTKPLQAWYPNTVNTARTVIRYNLVVAFSLRGELDKATEVLQQIWMSKAPGSDVPIHVVMLALYVELQRGHSDLARSIVKQHLPQYR